MVLSYLQHNLSQLLDDNQLSSHEKAVLVYDATLFWTRHFFTCEKERMGKQIMLGAELVEGLFKCIQNKKFHYDLILQLCDHGQPLYTHSLNTCLISLGFTKHLGWPEGKIKAFGLGALLHDIGMTKIAPEILYKSGPLLDMEWRQVQNHPFDGFTILKNYTNLCYDALLMVHQHHEQGDGSGYPDGLKLSSIHPWARILRIIDSYEALTARRNWRPPLPPFEALSIMRHQCDQSGVYHPNLLTFFIKFLAD
ncbi:MAG: hypothetical protein BZ151_02525 [Desulfobacca sp. 4484_104]|nr:MAG: hypothetical protein BZ151_02525 [Desulfobacca sp. 4484_104]